MSVIEGKAHIPVAARSFWDGLIEYLNDLFMRDDLENGNDHEARDHERMLRIMASETRFARRIAPCRTLPWQLRWLWMKNPSSERTQMDQGYISAIAALAGTVIGGLTSFATTWLTQNVQARNARMTADRTKREELYGSFMVSFLRRNRDILVSDHSSNGIT